MSNPLVKVSDIIEKKLQCYICFEQVGPDAVETVCEGRHTFCFSCICQHITAGITGVPTTAQLFPSEVDTPSCPVCRGGRCSIMPSQFLASLSDAMGKKREGAMDWLKTYKELLPLLKHKSPVVYENFRGRDNGEINCSQIRLFMYYKNHPEKLVPRLQSSDTQTTYTARQRRNAIFRPMPLSWASVAIDTGSNVFVVSKHRTETEAKNLACSAPASFDRTFVVGIYEEESLVMFQARPVQIFMSVGVEVGNYFDTTLPGSDSKESIVRLLDRPEILQAESGTGGYNTDTARYSSSPGGLELEQEDDSLSWLPM